MPPSLEVHANGTRIGYLVGLSGWTAQVFDPVLNVMFSVHASTGFMLGTTAQYTQANCTGEASVGIEDAYCTSLSGQPLPWGLAYALQGDDGWTRGVEVAVVRGPATGALSSASRRGTGACLGGFQNYACGAPLAVTQALPPSFALPITFVPSP